MYLTTYHVFRLPFEVHKIWVDYFKGTLVEGERSRFSIVNNLRVITYNVTFLELDTRNHSLLLAYNTNHT